jgi:hypothetical protein
MSAVAIDPMTRALAAWREHDVMRALHPVDRKAVAEAEAARALVLELLTSAALARDTRDLWSACARLGRLLADAGASPSLAAQTIDGALRALADVGLKHDIAREGPARASVLEGYAAAIRDAERGNARASWEYPGCAVRVDAETVAIACGAPFDDGDALASWAAKVASRASRDGFRRAVLSGQTEVRNEVADALRFVGIEVREVDTPSKDKAAPDERPRRWLRLPFWK